MFLRLYQGHSKVGNWGGGGDINISVLTKQLISKEINCAEPEYMNIPPPPIIELATALCIQGACHSYTQRYHI